MIIHIELVPEFKGERVVLLAMDGDGLDAVRAALLENQQGRQATIPLARNTIVFKVELNAASIDIQRSATVWRLAPGKVDEIV
ncbi:MAG: hypothetical protein AB7S71_04240 [Dongiaceae bacterium]